MAFASVYPHYINKAEKKGRTKEEVHAIIHWLTGYDEQALQQQIDKKVDFETFFARAPRMNPNVSKITGVICGYRVEEIEDKLMQQIRYLDKLVDELARGKAMDKILRNRGVDVVIVVSEAFSMLVAYVAQCGCFESTIRPCTGPCRPTGFRSTRTTWRVLWWLKRSRHSSSTRIWALLRQGRERRALSSSSS